MKQVRQPEARIHLHRADKSAPPQNSCIILKKSVEACGNRSYPQSINGEPVEP